MCVYYTNIITKDLIEIKALLKFTMHEHYNCKVQMIQITMKSVDDLDYNEIAKWRLERSTFKSLSANEKHEF